ncbi:phage holin family protein [Roseivivax sp. CAU 1761]
MADPLHDTPHTPREEGVRSQIRDTGNLLTDLINQVTRLVRGEIDLFRTELDENMRKAGTAIGMIVAGVVIFLVSLNVLASALVVALTEIGIDAGWSALIVGIVFAVVAAILAKKGANDLKLKSLAPTRTAKNVRRDSETVKEAM